MRVRESWLIGWKTWCQNGRGVNRKNKLTKHSMSCRLQAKRVVCVVDTRSLVLWQSWSCFLKLCAKINREQCSLVCLFLYSDCHEVSEEGWHFFMGVKKLLKWRMVGRGKGRVFQMFLCRFKSLIIEEPPPSSFDESRKRSKLVKGKPQGKLCVHLNYCFRLP